MRSRAFGLMALALAVAWGRLALASASDPEFSARLDQAQDAHQAGQLAVAEELYRELLSLYPHRVAPYQGLAEVLAAQGHRQEAVEMLLEVGDKLQKAERSGEAVAPLELTVRLDPERAEAHALLGQVLAEDGRQAEAAGSFERAFELGDRRLPTLLALGSLSWDSERYARAEEAFRFAAERYRETFGARFHLGRYLLWQGRAAESLPHLLQAAELRKDDVEARFLLARAYRESGDPERAISAFERVLALEPQHARAAQALRLLRSRRGAQPAVRLETLVEAEAAVSGVVLRSMAQEAGIQFRHHPATSPERHLPETMGSGLAWLDFDGDGWWDLYLVQSGPYPPDGSAAAANRLYRNLGPGSDGVVRFEDRTDAAGAGDRCYGQGALAADVDGDGDQDLYLTCYGPDVLLDNQGDGSFAVAPTARGLGADGWSSGAAFADAEGDGDLDLYITGYLAYDPDHGRFCGDRATGERDYCNVLLFSGEADVLYLQDPEGRFEESTLSAGIEDPWGRGLGVVWTDLDGDLRPDLYVANDLDPNRLYRNRGDGTFEDVSALSGTATNRAGQAEAGMGVAAADLDGDGGLDLLVTNFDLETNTHYRNLGDLAFDDVSAVRGFGRPSYNHLGFGLAVADFNLDGNLDAYVANGHVFARPDRPSVERAQPDLLLLGDGSGGFVESGHSAADPRVGRGAGVVDLEGDGDPDLAVQNNAGEPWLLQNPASASTWLGVELRGLGRNSQAIGARVVLRTSTRSQVRQVMAGSSYQSSADRRLLFAWRPTERVVELEVTWPSGRRSRWRPPPVGRYLRIFEPSLERRVPVSMLE